MYSLYLSLALVTVTLHVSTPIPTPKHPHQYGITTCSGVFISPDEILTNNHCIEDSRGHQWVKTFEGSSYPVIIVKVDKERDLALLKVTKLIKHKYASLGNPILITEEVYTVNSGDNYINTFSKGIVSNIIIDNYFGIVSVLHNVIFKHGASGSGLFNKKGKLVGINYLIDGLMESIDITEVKAFLRSCGK